MEVPEHPLLCDCNTGVCTSAREAAQLAAGGSSEANDCCICAEELINDNRTSCCKQRIHKDCLHQCLRRFGNTCPLCRTRIAVEAPNAVSIPASLRSSFDLVYVSVGPDELSDRHTFGEAATGHAAERMRSSHTFLELMRMETERRTRDNSAVEALRRQELRSRQAAIRDARAAARRGSFDTTDIDRPRTLAEHDVICARICADMGWNSGK